MRKNIIIAVLAILAISLALNQVAGWFTLLPKEKIAKEAMRKTVYDTVTFKKYVTKDSITHLKFEDKKGQILSNNISASYNSYVEDTLAPALKIATNKITELTRINAVLEGKLKATKIERDSANHEKVFFQNKYLSIVTNDADSTATYAYNAVLDIAAFEKRNWIFGKEKNYLDISSPDKNFKIDGVERFRKEIYIRPKRFGIGFQAGYYFLPSEGIFVPALGFGLSYNFIRF